MCENIKLSKMRGFFFFYLKFASQDLRKNFGQAPPPNCCIQNLLTKENKTICEASGLMAIQVQWDENELPLPDGVDVFPWHLLLAKCFIKQTHDLKDLCKCGVSTEKKMKKKKNTHLQKNKFCSYLKVIS